MPKENWISNGHGSSKITERSWRRRLAVEAGDFVSIKNGDEEIKCPAIKVVCDGSWSKRSYGHSYNSKYGNAAIIGVRTKKVLFVGERVTTCRMCQINSKTNKESPPHM
ncbi:hypothetical protein Ocin01_15191 [Orchesella cincta]|uniref:Mutator-like transposase domain-containing protein n=1 Tax=Orchesella cincta TaxID=48709 RepID=A0A1D2MEP9_ORCCI|nr:hypothetical protein Ocin01_15191 [Orchesella cincta]